MQYMTVFRPTLYSSLSLQHYLVLASPLSFVNTLRPKKNVCTPSPCLTYLIPNRRNSISGTNLRRLFSVATLPGRICKNEFSCIQAVPQSIKSFFSWHCEIFRASNDIVTVCACKPRVSVINSMLRHMS
jgi:hypothetical protein